MADNVDWAKRVIRLWMFAEDTPSWSFDAVMRESHHSELVVTDNPVETGVVVADHAYMAPLRLDIEAAVGDFWLHAVGPNGAAVDDPFASSAGRSVSAFEQLQALQATAEPFSVQAGLRLYDNMVIVTIDVDQDANTGNILKFRASLREVIFASTQTVTYPPRAAGKPDRQAKKKVSAGEKKTEPPKSDDQMKSLLRQAGVGDDSPIMSKVGQLFSLGG